MRHAAGWALATIALATATMSASIGACGGKGAKLPSSVGIAATGAPPPGPRIKLPEPSPLGVDEHLILTIGEKTIGPFLARRGDALLAAYIGTSETGSRRIVDVPLGPTGEPRGDAKVVAGVAADATALVLRTTGGDRSGFIAAWTSLTDRGEALSVVGIGEDGRPHAAPTELARTPDHIVWVDIVPTSRGAIAVWAEETSAGNANVVSAALGPDGAMRGVPARIARGVTGWQVVASKEGASLAVVTSVASGDPQNKSKHLGNLAWLRMDASGRPIGAPIAIATKAALGGDVDVVRNGDASVLAWTDVSESDPHVILATIDDAGNVRGPLRTPDVAASLVGIAAGPAGAVVAWEDPLKRGRGMRHVYAARIEPGPAIDPKTVVPLELQGRGAPEIVGTREGFALLAPARACWEKGDGACDAAPVIPTLLRFDAQLAVTQVEPLRMGSVREPATLGWGLTCGAEQCLALATANEQPTVVRTVDLKPRATPFRAPVTSIGPSDAPRVQAVTTLDVGAFADLAAARVGDGTLVALLGATLDEPTTKRDPVSNGATLLVRALDANGVAIDKGVMLTKRALTIGGVAIAAGGKPDDGAAIAWVAREAGDPQVHVTRVDAHGKRLNDVQLTTAKGDASDVAIAWAGDGWVIAWVDARDGNGEIYATKVDHDLRRVAREERITQAAGDASDVAMIADGDRIWLAWADPRESPGDGFADVYVAPLRAHDATKAEGETRILATAAHSRSPALAMTGDQLAVAWIEEAPMGADTSSSQAYGAMMAWLDGHGRPLRDPGHLAGAGDGFPSGLTLEGSRESLHVILARAARESIELDAIEITHDPSPKSYTILGLDGPPSLDVAFTLLGDALYFNDEGQDPGERRARRARIAWKR